MFGMIVTRTQASGYWLAVLEIGNDKKLWPFHTLRACTYCEVIPWEVLPKQSVMLNARRVCFAVHLL